MVGLIVPVMKNFKGFTKLMKSVDVPVTPYVINNWDNNHGVSSAWNTGLFKSLGEPLVIIVNDDVEFHKGTITKLIDRMEQNPSIDLLSAVSTDTGQTGINFDHFPDFACFAVRPAEFLNKFGDFDTGFYPAYFEDNDMSYRIKLAGGRQGLLLEARIEHEGSATQYMDATPVVPSAQFEQNRAYYIQKWGGNPGEEVYTEPFGGQ